MRRFVMLSLLLAARILPAQGFWDSSVRTGPQFFSYDIHGSEEVSEIAFPVFVLVPVTSQFSLDVGTAYASVDLDRTNADQTHTKSTLAGLTDTQVRGNLTLGGDLLVLTAGLNLPTGSSTVATDEIDAATRIGSDFLAFPISGFGSGFSMTGGAAVARSLGAWNVGIGGSVRQSTEYTPFRDAADSAVKFTPGPEYRLRAGIDHARGTGRVSLGFMYSRFGDDKANAATYNTGDRYVGQFAVSNSIASHLDYSFVAWDLYRTAGTLIDGSVSPSSNMTNALVGLAIGGSSVSVQPTLEGRVVAGQELAKTNAMATAGLRLVINRGAWTVVPGGAYSYGHMDQGSLTGVRGTLAIRVGL